MNSLYQFAYICFIIIRFFVLINAGKKPTVYDSVIINPMQVPFYDTVAANDILYRQTQESQSERRNVNLI